MSKKFLGVLSVLIILLLSMVYGSFDNNQKHETQVAVLKVGYLTYPPSFIQDPNTKEFSGIFYEILEEIASNLNLKLDYTSELGWATMFESVKSNKVDIIVTGIWPNQERAKHADFVVAPYNSPVLAYVKAGDQRFDGDISLVNDSSVTIATIDGEINSQIANDDFPLANQLGLPQMTPISNLLLEVSLGKADITFVEPAFAKAFMAANPGKIQVVSGIESLRSFPNSMVVKKGNQQLLDQINAQMKSLIRSGFVDDVLDKYEQYPGSFQRNAY